MASSTVPVVRRRQVPTTAAAKVLNKNLDRSRAFTKMFFAATQKRGRGQPSQEENELKRAAVIFSIGALDAYLSEVSAEVLITQLERANVCQNGDARQLLRRIAKEIDTLPLELALVTDVQTRRAVARDALLDHLTSSVSNHGSTAIATTLRRIGVEDIRSLWATLDDQRPYWPKLATASRTSAAILDHWTGVRHEIVHRGVAPRVAGQQAEELIEFVATVGKAVDSQAIAALSVK